MKVRTTSSRKIIKCYQNTQRYTSFELFSDEIVNLFRCTKPKLVFCDADAYSTVKNSLEIIGRTAAIYIVAGKLEKGMPNTVDQIIDQTTDEEAQKFR